MKSLSSPCPRAVLVTAGVWVRLRYLLLVAVGVTCMVPPYLRTWHTLNEWNVFEVGARTIVSYHGMWQFGGGALHLYSNNPLIQIGPPPILALALFQWANPQLVAFIFAMSMVLMGVASIFAVERMALALVPADRWPALRAATATLGLGVIGFWSREVGHWRHLDDALTVAALSFALMLCARRKHWWLVPVLLGFAVATKPWAVVLAPVLLGLPRSRRATGFLLMLASAAVWWLPFLVADHQTASALSSYHITPRPGSLPFVFVHYDEAQHWVRPVQMLVATALAMLVVRRGGWLYVPFVGLVARVVTDPFLYSYYSMGPIICAFALDLVALGRRRVPAWTISTVLMLYGAPLLLSGTDLAVARVLWLVGIVCLLGFPRGAAAERALGAGVRPGVVDPALV